MFLTFSIFWSCELCNLKTKTFVTMIWSLSHAVFIHLFINSHFSTILGVIYGISYSYPSLSDNNQMPWEFGSLWRAVRFLASNSHNLHHSLVAPPGTNSWVSHGFLAVCPLHRLGDISRIKEGWLFPCCSLHPCCTTLSEGLQRKMCVSAPPVYNFLLPMSIDRWVDCELMQLMFESPAFSLSLL